MYILGIETSSGSGSVALGSESGMLEGECFADGARHARDIFSHIDSVLRRCGIGKDRIDSVAVSAGPGSFTGLRVGVTCAKTLAYVLGWDVAGICSLEVLAQNVDVDDVPCNYICPLRDARRGGVYGRMFQKTPDGWTACGGVMIDTPDRLAGRLPAGAMVFGSGVDSYPEIFGVSRFSLPPENTDYSRPCAEAVVKLGIARTNKGRSIPPMELIPRYYRLTEVEERSGA